MTRIALILALTALPAVAGDVEIVAAEATPSGDAWRFSVTLRHADTGWDHYADGWEVLGPDGNRLGFRELLHPHVNEQPFTRSLNGVQIPGGVTEVTIRAHDNVHGWAEETLTLTLPR
ncbi:hypothetical protein ACMU_16190 [Actibacterium mucosum KCTC 23349]|uniref:Uncharacterized protein n=1 Tax=Actibacterium mucosum KCTC 23349 TaxID=1454373 RepID=A0A037ZDT2_9RHOB|nr:hypothetical protein [Actibacterium mucosum]KAJ54654.1 hypothetical protein ACMU_16190 [Actibacterium mucosum KCTC 23349]